MPYNAIGKCMFCNMVFTHFDMSEINRHTQMNVYQIYKNDSD